MYIYTISNNKIQCTCMHTITCITCTVVFSLDNSFYFQNDSDKIAGMIISDNYMHIHIHCMHVHVLHTGMYIYCTYMYMYMYMYVHVHIHTCRCMSLH